MFRNKIILILIFQLFFLGRGSMNFAQVSPEIQIGARGVMSFNLDFLSDKTSSAVNDFSDSSFLLGFRQKLYKDFRGQFVLGFQFPDADSNLGQIFFHQVFLKIENKSNILKIGRSRVKSALIEFPTLRDDDALHFTDVLNPFSSGENTEASQYGNVLEFSHIFGQRYLLRIHGEHFTETPPASSASETDFSLNAIGLSFQYLVPESQRWNRKVLDQVGISFNNFLTDRPGYSKTVDRALKNVILSTVVNVHPDPVHFWDVRHQTIYNLGFSEIDHLNNYQDMTRSKSLSTFTSVRYLYRRLERPTVQLSGAFGYKTFLDLQNATRQMQLITNVFYRLGENFDIGFQVQYLDFSGDLERLFGRSETRVQFSIVYSVDQSWNHQFDDRDSLLNLEHGYIK